MAMNKNTVLATASQETPDNAKFCLTIKANKNEKQATPMSSKNIIHLGTILKFLNITFDFD